VEYEFLFVVDGVSIDDDGAVAILTDTFDGLLSWSRGLHRLVVSGEGTNAADALQNLLRQIASELPALRILRLDPDLVGVSDIAERTGHSRQNVQQWVTGERNAGHPFPAPEGTAGRSLVWRWADVNEWLKPLGLDDQVKRPTRDESILLDFTLMKWNNALVGGLQPRDEDPAARELASADSLTRTSRAPGATAQGTAVMHRNMIARIPAATGRDLREWFRRLESGPAFRRAEERADWLADEHGLSHGYANAIVHEYELRRRLRLTSEGMSTAEDKGSHTPRTG
jgi:predicted DNA-binding transcriptional regulator AlpA